MKPNIKALLLAKFIFPFLLLLFSFTPGEASNLQKSTVIKKEFKINGNFESIRFDGNVSVVLTNEPPGTIIIEGKEKLMDKISSIFENKTLTIDLASGRLFAKLTVYLSAKTLHNLQVNGDGDISSNDFLQSDTLRISLNGNIKVKVKTMGEISLDTPDDIDLIWKSSPGKVLFTK